MKSFFISTLIALSGVILLSGCPEEVGNELDTSMFIRNNTSDSLYLRWYNKTRVSEADYELTAQDISLIYNFQNSPELVIAMNAEELREFEDRISMETLVESPFGTYRYLINIDTLKNYTSSTWDGQSGVKRYYLYSLSDYHQINFTMEYP